MQADYAREWLGDETIEREEGFATFRYIERDGIKSVYIVNIYVRPDFRKTKVASEMADKIAEQAKELGCAQMLGSVVPTARNSTESIRVLLGYGMTLLSASNDFIIFKKGL